MKRLLMYPLMLVTASLILVGCAQAPPPAAPTQAAVGAPKAGEPTKAPAPQPTAVTAKKVDYPEKGRKPTFLLSTSPTSSTNTTSRLLAPYLQKELGTELDIVNKSGAGNQIGYTELAAAKPDGYTFGTVTLNGMETIMLNPERQATFTRDSFIPLGFDHADPGAIAVAANGPYKSLQDIINAAKAGKVIRAGTSAVLGDDELAILAVQKAAGGGVKFAAVNFDSGADRTVAMLGGKIDVSFGNFAAFWPDDKAGQVKIIAMMADKPWKLAPNIPTLESMGIKSYAASTRAFLAPKGVPQDIVDILVGAFQRAITGNPERHQKMEELGYVVEYKSPAQVSAYWDELHRTLQPLMQEAIANAKK